MERKAAQQKHIGGTKTRPTKAQLRFTKGRSAELPRQHCSIGTILREDCRVGTLGSSMHPKIGMRCCPNRLWSHCCSRYVPTLSY